jgi:hypothetical protein
MPGMEGTRVLGVYFAADDVDAPPPGSEMPAWWRQARST